MITIVKKAPSDDVAKRILVDWFDSCRPKWKQPLDLCLGCFFLATALFSWWGNSAPGFIWLSLSGAILSFVIAFGYIPFLAKSALSINKKQSSYYREKTYRFSHDHLYFSYEGANETAVPLNKFTELRLTKEGILLLNGDKLVLWFSHSDLSLTEEQTIIKYFENNEVVINEKR